MPSELVLYLFLLDTCKNRHISGQRITEISHRVWTYIQRYGAVTVVLGEYTLSMLFTYPRVKDAHCLYLPIYLVY